MRQILLLSMSLILAGWLVAQAAPLIQDGATDNPAAESAAEATTDAAAAEADGDAEAEAETRRKPFQDEILMQLLREQEAPKAIPQQDPSTPDDLATRGPDDGRELLVEGTMIVERPAELETGAESVRLVIRLADGERTLALEPLESSLRELLERQAKQGATNFTISGEVTRYRGKNYLLLRKVIQRVDNGNLRP